MNSEVMVQSPKSKVQSRLAERLASWGIDPVALVQTGLARNLIRPPSAEPANLFAVLKEKTQANNEERLRYDGKPRTNRCHPELKGVIGSDYSRLYNRKVRAEAKRELANKEGRKA